MSLTFQPVFTVKVEVDKPIEVGAVGAGIRRVIPIIGGSFEGELLNGTILPGGADYQIIRPDGVTEVEAHYTLRTNDGAHIYVKNNGYRHGPREIIEKLIKGEEVPDGSYYFKTTPRFEVSDEKYAFLNRNIFVGIGKRKPACVEIEYYQLM